MSAIGNYMDQQYDRIRKLEAKNAELEKKIEIACEALEFFEKIDNYDGGLNCNVVINGFSVSREALSKIKSEGL